MHGPTDPELWEAIDALMDIFDRAAETAPRLNARLAEARSLRDRGIPWADMLAPESSPVLISATNELLDDLVTVGARLRRLIAQALYADGMSIERIAAAFGVTRQRISALLHADP